MYMDEIHTSSVLFISKKLSRKAWGLEKLEKKCFKKIVWYKEAHYYYY